MKDRVCLAPKKTQKIRTFYPLLRSRKTINFYFSKTDGLIKPFVLFWGVHLPNSNRRKHPKLKFSLSIFFPFSLEANSNKITKNFRWFWESYNVVSKIEEQYQISTQKKGSINFINWIAHPTFNKGIGKKCKWMKMT